MGAETPKATGTTEHTMLSTTVQIMAQLLELRIVLQNYLINASNGDGATQSCN